MESIALNEFTKKEQQQLKDNLIEIPRGDFRQKKFKVSNDVIPLITEIYITAKKSAKDTEYLFQKTLTGGDITYNDGYYIFAIRPEDTAELKMEKEYIYDIELVGSGLRYTTLGLLRITTEVTTNER